MKFQRTSLILVFAALGLGGFVYLFESRNKPQTEQSQSESKPIFAFKESDVQAFTIQTPKQTLSFDKVRAPVPKGATNVEPGTWMMRKPANTQAEDGAVAFLLNLMATGTSDRTLSIPIARKTEFGLDKPTATIQVKLANQQSHRLVLGKPNFNRNSLYALGDPPANSTQDLSVLLVPIDFQNAVDRPLTEWKKEPATKTKDKPKSGPKVTTTPAPSLSVSPSPRASASPSPR
jgi:hypothetical protein